MTGLHTKCLFLVLALFTLFSGTPVALADSASAGADVQVAQSLGERELTVVARRVTSIPGPLYVDVITHRGAPAGPLRVQLVHRCRYRRTRTCTGRADIDRNGCPR
ncbi:Uncharacterised protein [Mycobacteroides abscessus subsp. abscessus]|nr:Uncharacterised protein [Mycobacteroides abscessus subsp. abscessus]